MKIKLPSTDELFSQLKGAASKSLSQDIETIAAFSKNQLAMIAQHSTQLAADIAAGAFKGNEEFRDKLVKNVANLLRTFVETFQAMGEIAIEKLWNALVGVIWGVIDKALGFPLPRPSL